MPKHTNFETYINFLNQLTEKNKKLFRIKPVFFSKQLAQNHFKVKSSCSDNQIFLKSSIKKGLPYIKIKEEWYKDRKYSYEYKFVVPYFDFIFACDDETNKIGCKEFEFRYEVHPQIKDHKPKFHLHVFDNVIPSYFTQQVEFVDFFNIIQKDFVKNDKVDFNY